jgi:histidinol-phosphate/aromatic aminotransferase/cobyric acid decarboxylase-like protein
VAERAAIAALTDDREWVAEHIALVREYRERFRCEIATLESDANFVFVPMANGPEVARRMRECGIAVRGFEGGIRVTIGPWDLMQACIDAIGDL